MSKKSDAVLTEDFVVVEHIQGLQRRLEALEHRNDKLVAQLRQLKQGYVLAGEAYLATEETWVTIVYLSMLVIIPRIFEATMELLGGTEQVNEEPSGPEWFRIVVFFSTFYFIVLYQRVTTRRQRMEQQARNVRQQQNDDTIDYDGWIDQILREIGNVESTEEVGERIRKEEAVKQHTETEAGEPGEETLVYGDSLDCDLTLPPQPSGGPEDGDIPGDEEEYEFSEEEGEEEEEVSDSEGSEEEYAARIFPTAEDNHVW